MSEVVIVGAGPTGLALACELRLAGIDCTVLERRSDIPNLTRAFAVHARTLELLDARGLADELITAGIPVHEVAPAPGAVLSLRSLPTRYPMVLIVPQSGTELLLEKRFNELGGTVQRGRSLSTLTQSDSGVTLTLDDGSQLTPSYVVGTDGAHSTVRDQIGVDFVGEQYSTHIILADVQLSRPPQQTLFGVASHLGLTLFVPFGDGWFRAIVWDRAREDVPLDEPVTLDELRGSFQRIAGDDYGMGEPRWRTRFLSERRQARHYRVGRVFLAGDAAHVHSPLGGQGMNTGIGDAVNLGWKLAMAVRGDESQLDSYEAERHPVGAGVLRLTDAFNRLILSGSERGLRLRQRMIRLLLGFGPFRSRIAGRLSGLSIHYGPHHRVPDLATSEGRLYEVLRAGKFVLINAMHSHDRVVCVTSADHTGVTLVRPDGYAAHTSLRGADVLPVLRRYGLA